MAKGPGSFLEELVRDYSDFFPVHWLMPNLTAAEIERFVSLGDEGRRLFRSGDTAGAERAFLGQLAIFSGNHEPFLYLAFIEAMRGSEDKALDRLRAAVLRGYSDLQHVERAEAWRRLRRHPRFLSLQDCIPSLLEVDREWPTRELFKAGLAPDSLEVVLREHAGVVERINRMAPAFGPKLTERWKILADRMAAAMLETYVAKKPQAPDFADALERIMAFYAAGPLLRWGLLPEEPARRFGKICETMLQSLPDSNMRPVALVGRALSKNTERDKRGVLRESAAGEIFKSLEEVLILPSNTAVAPIAAVGLIHTELNLGRRDAAAERYRRLREEHSGDSALLGQVREDLGEWALLLGGLPDFSASTFEGKTVSSDELAGKIAVIDFWATWCSICVEGFPALRRIEERHGEDVLLLGVNLDYADDLPLEDLREWIASNDVRGSHLYDGQSWESPLVKSFGVKEIPFSVVVAANGDVLAVNEHGKRLEKAVKAAVREESASP
jgi:thiol-disulfide isomerase/thioredoxin